MLKVVALAAGLAVCEGYVLGAAPTRVAASRPAAAVFMDETILEKALAGELEEEGAENIFLSEVGWAAYLDKNAQSSYNMNQRPSLASDGYYTASILDSPAIGERHTARAADAVARCCCVAGSAAARQGGRAGGGACMRERCASSWACAPCHAVMAMSCRPRQESRRPGRGGCAPGAN